MNFVHLRLHTEYSLADSTIRIKPLMKAVEEAGMSAIAMTDLNNLFAMVKFYRATMAAGLKPIFGVDVLLDNKGGPPFHLILLCQNTQGYLNLSKLISKAYLKGQRNGLAFVNKEWIAEHAEGVICLSGGKGGDVGKALLDDNQELAQELASDWLKVFGDRYYLELQRTGREGDEDYLHAAVNLAVSLEIPVVATNDVRFLKEDDFYSHEARTCISEGYVLDDSNRPKNYSPQQYLRTAEEMSELFSDIPEALENSVEIAKRCSVTLTLGKNYLPDFPIPEGMTEAEFFAEESRKGLELRLDFLFGKDSPGFAEKRKEYDERLQIELDVINGMGFPGYFLIVADFIQWAKDNGVPVGPGRGSGAGSLVAYALKITDLDPLEYDLLFERFLNPERVSMPDFDIDFCTDGRDRVIDYVSRTYGREKVSQIITYGSMAAKAVVRDVGRVLGHPYGFVDRVAKQIPFEIGMTLTKALVESEDLKAMYDNDEEVTALLDLALSLEGLSRNAGKHAGGVLIAPTDLTDFTPLYCEEDGSNVVSQYDKNDVEAVGLVKFDFLGLRNLTIIDMALKIINARRKKKGEEPLEIERISLEDKPSFDLLKACKTTAVFQLESRGMKELIKRLQPDVFEDIVALVALYRPGPLGSGMVDDFVERKHGRQKTEYPHPWLESILKPTYGVILYQEQVMQIAQVLASYTLGGADMLRRAMGKKKPEEMEKQRSLFMAGAVKNDVEEATATYIFDLMEKFAGYGFNKSHSAAYALVSYQTAWIKAHYPSEFMAAVLSSDMDNTEKVVNFVDDCRQLGLTVVPPNVNLSDYKFTVDDD
ncbi:MAG: DNA polymerase III alpha subunit (EC, partial [uncultured Thiotrichaceae bacterium]